LNEALFAWGVGLADAGLGSPSEDGIGKTNALRGLFDAFGESGAPSNLIQTRPDRSRGSPKFEYSGGKLTNTHHFPLGTVVPTTDFRHLFPAIAVLLFYTRHPLPLSLDPSKSIRHPFPANDDLDADTRRLFRA
jgi:hypothetical protein